MSEYHHPSYFIQQAGSQSGEYFDDILGVNDFNVQDLDYGLGNDQFLEQPEELPNDQAILPAEDSLNHEEPQESLPNVDVHSQSDANGFWAGQGEVSSLENTFPANEHPTHGRPRHDESNGSSPSRNDLNEFVDQEDFPNLQNTIPAYDPLSNVQPEEVLANGQQQFHSDFSEEWDDFPEIPDTVAHVNPVYHASNPQGNFNIPAASPNLYSVENGEGSVANIPGIDSGYGTLDRSREGTSGQLSAAPYQMNNAAQRSGLGNMQNGQGPAYASQHPGANNKGKKVKKQAKEEPAESDPNFDPANDLNYYAEDPDTGVIESRRRNGWGRTGRRNGVEVWLNPETDEWQESASHHSYREILIARAQAEHPNERYLYPDPIDGLPHGETAFFLPHQNLGPGRDDCPDELFAWHEDELGADADDDSDDDDSEDDPRDDMVDKEAGNKGPAKKKRKLNPRSRGPRPEFWFEDNKILLDPHNNPVKKHLDMPLTLSSQTEGCKLQLMRLLNAGISQRDVWARMPRWIRRKIPKTDRFIIRYIGSPNTHVNMPSQRFRDEKGTVAGSKRDGTKKLKEGLKAYFAEHGFDPSLTGSTRGFGRDLMPWEQDLVKLGNTGKHPGRAGEDRALDDETRNKNLQKIMKKIKKGREKMAADAAKAGGASGHPPAAPLPHQNTSILEAGESSNSRTYGAAPLPYQNASTLEAGGRSSYGTYGAAASPYIPSHPGVGPEYDENFDQFQQESRGPTWSAQGHIERNYHPAAQYQQQYATDYTGNNPYSSPVPHQGLSNGANGARKHKENTLGQGGRKVSQAPKQVLGKRGRKDTGEVDEGERRRENDAAEAARPFPSAQNETIEPEYHAFYNETRQEHDVEDWPSEQQQVGELESTIYAIKDPEDAAPSKRRRKNGNSGKEPRRQRRRQNGRTPQTQYYGAGGAPSSLPSPEELFGNRPDIFEVNIKGDAAGLYFDNTDNNYANTGNTFEWNAEDQGGQNYAPSGRTLNAGPDMTGDAAGLFLDNTDNNNGNTGNTFDWNAEDQGRQNYAPNGRTFNAGPDAYQPTRHDYLVDWPVHTSNDQNLYSGSGANVGPGAPPNGDMYGALGPVAGSNESVEQGMSDARPRPPEHLQRISEGWVPQQILGKHSQEEPAGEWDQEAGAPEQDLGDQQSEAHVGDEEEDSHEPKTKRRRMPVTEGYYAPPAQGPRASTAERARKEERDAHLPPLELHINERLTSVDQAPRVEDAHSTPREIYVNGSTINFDEVREVADAEDPDQPQAPTQTQSEQQAPSDIRDVRPVNAWQTLSLDNALRYTREDYLEWAGTEAPPTNLEDSYNVQYREIRAAFQAWWTLNQIPLNLGPRPELFRLKVWSGAIEDWKAPENREHLFEAMRRGRYAARNEDGSLQQPDFRWKYEEYRWYNAKEEEEL